MEEISFNYKTEQRDLYYFNSLKMRVKFIRVEN